MKGSPIARLIWGLLLSVSLLTPGGVRAEDADPAAMVALPLGDSGTATCGPDTVTWDNHASFDRDVPGNLTLRVSTADESLLVDLSRPLDIGERVFPLWCGDLLGDGSQALAMEAFSGGAHCCFTASVVLLQPDGPHLLDAPLGNGGLTVPTQLDDGGPLELPATSDVFAYFDHLSFAASPFLPLVFAYDGSEYVEATRNYPGRLRQQLATAESDLDAAVAHGVPPGIPADLDYQGQESMALRVYALHWLLGDADAALPRLKQRVSPPTAAWLDANLADARTALQERYGAAS